MGEYANLTIWRKLEEDNEEYQRYYTIYQDRELLLNFRKDLGKDALKFGQLSFKTVDNNIYYSHVPVSRFVEEHQKEEKWDINEKWLTFFTKDEIEIVDKFEIVANTTVLDAINRIDAVIVTDSAEWAIFRSDYYCWLKVYAKPYDILTLSSNNVYFPFDETEKPINLEELLQEKMTEIKKEVTVPHWD